MGIDKALESAKSIKLTGGVFGKTTLLLIILCLCVGTLCFKLNIWWMTLILVLPLMTIVTYVVCRCLNFAEKNPQAAIMEGAELLMHERIVYGMKGVSELPVYPPDIDHQPPLLPLVEVEDTDQLPPETTGIQIDSQSRGK